MNFTIYVITSGTGNIGALIKADGPQHLALGISSWVQNSNGGNTPAHVTTTFDTTGVAQPYVAVVLS